MRDITLNEVASLLSEHDNIKILTHRYPDHHHTDCHGNSQQDRHCQLMSITIPPIIHYQRSHCYRQQHQPKWNHTPRTMHQLFHNSIFF